MRKSPHFIILIPVICLVSQIVVLLYNKQPSYPKKGLIVRLKDSSTKWQVTLRNRNNEPVYSVATFKFRSTSYYSGDQLSSLQESYKGDTYGAVNLQPSSRFYTSPANTLSYAERSSQSKQITSRCVRFTKCLSNLNLLVLLSSSGKTKTRLKI